MNKFLRYSLLSLLTLLVTAISAQKQVTIDFDNDYQTIFPTITGVSSNESNAGDFTEPTVAVVGDLMIAVTPAEDAKTPSRIWGTSPRLRMYSGTFSIVSMAGNITKIEFTGHNSNFNLTPLTGTLEGKTWTGNEQTVIFSVAKNTQISSMVVTIGGEVGPDDPDDPDNPENPLAKFIFQSGTVTESADGNQVLVDYVALNSEAEITGKMIFEFENSLFTLLTMSANFPTVEMAQAYYEETLANKDKEGILTVTIEGKTVTVTMKSIFETLSKIAIKSLMKFAVNNEPGGTGLLDSPLSPNQANVFAGTLETNKVSEETVYIKGKVAAITYPFDAQHGTATFYISIDGNNDFTFQCYSVYYLENKSWVEGNTQIKEGDEVIICGKLVNYNGITPETASKQAYIYSLNGVTQNEGGSTPDPKVQEITVAQSLAIIEGLGNGAKTTEQYLVKGYVVAIDEISTQFGNATFDIADEKGGQPVLKVYRCKGYNGENVTDENIVKIGDLVEVQGLLQKYVKNEVITPEVATGGQIISINGIDASVNTMKANEDKGAVYNLAGQRVSKTGKGLYIQNGKKYIVK
jgi:hypothetical protein